MVAKFKRNKKGRSQSILFSILLGVFIFGIAGFLVISNLRISQRRTELNSQIELLNKELQELEEKNIELKAAIEQGVSPEYLEKVAREELNLKKEGEEAIVVKKITGQEEGEEAKKEKNLWQEFLEKIGL
jgi:cell division protein FtsB